MNQRMPVIRIRELRNHLADKTKHSQALDKIEPNDRENSDHCSDQCRADKALVPGCANNQAETQKCKNNLDENSERDVHKNARCCGWNRCAVQRRKPRPNDIAAHSRGRHERAD